MSLELPKLILPNSLIGRFELSELMREVEDLDMALEGQKVRGTNKNGYKLPALSRSLSDFLTVNKLDINDDNVRLDIKKQLKIVKTKAPAIAITFATDADPNSLEQLVSWIRKELHPLAIINVGIQPGLIGGAYIRTPNHVHDFSMRGLFKGKTNLLLKDLEGLL
jgi:F0F1-type ATP synthase delta subunit